MTPRFEFKATALAAVLWSATLVAACATTPVQPVDPKSVSVTSYL
jgi:hypothetical protein